MKERFPGEKTPRNDKLGVFPQPTRHSFAKKNSRSCWRGSGHGRNIELIRERIGTQLEFHGFAGCALAAFDVPRGARGVCGPETLALPSGVRIVDTAIHALGKKAHGVGNAHHEELSGLGVQSFQGVRTVGGGDGDILTHSKRIKLVNPVVVVGIHASVFRGALKARPGRAIQRPALGAVLPGGRGAIERSFAFATVKAGEMSAGEYGPDHTVASDVHSPR